VVKLNWKVSPKPTGPFSWSHHRAWPSADYSNNRPAAFITCKDSYTPARARGESSHEELQVWLACYTSDGKFENKRLVKRAKTLSEAKELVNKFLESNSKYVHPDYQGKS